jgi:hypothetical protein
MPDGGDMDTAHDVGAGGAAGPVGAAMAALAGWLSAAAGAGTEVVTAPPADSAAARVCLWPLGLLPEREGRGGAGTAPMRLRARFLVVVDGPAGAAVSIVDRLLRAAVEPGAYQPAPEVVDPAVWQAMGVVPRPALLFDVPLCLDRRTPVAARVARTLRVDGAPIRSLHGRVVGPSGIGLPGIQVATGDAVTRTDSRGDFVLDAVTGDPVTVLRLAGKGLHLRAEVPAGSTDAVVVHCDIEEV